MNTTRAGAKKNDSEKKESKRTDIEYISIKCHHRMMKCNFIQIYSNAEKRGI